MTAADELRNARYQLDVYEALATVVGDAHELLEILLNAEDASTAHDALRRRYRFTEVQAAAVMELQFRRVTTLDRQRIEQRRDELAHHVEVLEREVAEG
jgi:DNA gyrase subunit A